MHSRHVLRVGDGSQLWCCFQSRCSDKCCSSHLVTEWSCTMQLVTRDRVSCSKCSNDRSSASQNKSFYPDILVHVLLAGWPLLLWILCNKPLQGPGCLLQLCLAQFSIAVSAFTLLFNLHTQAKR